jgi:hypothetical protein
LVTKSTCQPAHNDGQEYVFCRSKLME